jgi:sulfane dehydrogenase subunit SoxC
MKDQEMAPVQDKDTSSKMSRRDMLRKAGVSVGGSALVFTGMNNSEAKTAELSIPEWTTQQGSPAGNALYGEPSVYEKDVVRQLSSYPSVPKGYSPVQPSSSWSSTPWQNLHGNLTPNGLFYERHHGGVPTIDPLVHRLVLHGDKGLIKRELLFTIEDLMRFPSVTETRFLECSGNTDLEWEKPTGHTVQESHGLLSCCQWTGVRLSVLLEEAGVNTAKAKWILAEGADSAVMTRSIPMARALDDCMVAYAQNGERLRPEQGYPIRLLVPGCEGNINIKWLRRLEVSETPFYSREETAKYTDLTKDGVARKSTLVMEAKSVITFPSGGQQLPEKGSYEIRGIAWTGRGRITHVDISTDGGNRWQPAELVEPILPKCLTAFKMPWHWDGSETVVICRATDESGYVQPFRTQLLAARGKHSEYHYNGIHGWQVKKGGAVTRVKS